MLNPQQICYFSRIFLRPSSTNSSSRDTHRLIRHMMRPCTSEILVKRRVALGLKNVIQQPEQKDGPAFGYCAQCLRECSWPDYTSKKARLTNKNKGKCIICNNFVCRKDEHYFCLFSACNDETAS